MAFQEENCRFRLFRLSDYIMRKAKFGYIKDGNYICIGDNMHGIYKTYDDMRFNWQLVSQTEDDITKYYLLNNNTEAIVYVGRKDPWAPLTVGTKEQYLYMDNAQGSMQEVTTYDRVYITGKKRKQESFSIYKTINGEECLVTYAYYAINKNRGKEYNSKDAYVCEHYLTGEYAISNNDHHIILEGLKRVKLSDDNIAEVVFSGEDKTTWVNLYTMQEFDERPVVEKMGFMDMLRVGYNYYFYKNRDMAGIPMHHRDCVANDKVFQFLDQYLILRSQPDKVYYIYGERRGKEQWYLILVDITNANSKNRKEIPSMWLPRRS